MTKRRNRPQQRQYIEQYKADPNVAVVVSQQGVAAPATMPRNTRAYIQEGYRGNGTVFRVVGHIARAGAGIKWKHYTDETKKREMPSSELLQLWNHPSPRIAGTAFREAMLAYYCLTGNSYILGIQAKLQQNPTAPFDELYNLRPDITKVKVAENGPLYYEFGNFSPPKRYDDPFVMHNKLFAGNDDVYGMSPVEVAALKVDIQKAGQKWNLGLLSNMARPGGAWVTDALLGDTEYKSLKEEIRRKFSGPRNAGETAILHGGVKWQSMAMSPMELDWLESDTKSDRDIAGIFFNFPLFLLGLADSTYSNQEEARYALYTEIVFPLLDTFQDSANMWLTPRYGGFLGYDQEDVEAIQRRLQEAKGQASDRAQAEFVGGTTTFLEAREIQGRPKINVKDFMLIPNGSGSQIPIHVEDLDDYIAAVSGEKINPPAPPQLMPGDNSGDNSANTVDNQAGSDTAPPQKSQDVKKLKEVPKIITTSSNGDNQDTEQEDDDAIIAAGLAAGLAMWQIERRLEINRQIADYNSRNTTHLLWVVNGHPCELCEENGGEIIEVGDSFPNGFELPPVHPSCMCDVVELSASGTASQDVQPERKDEDEVSDALKKYVNTLPQLAVTREQYRELLRMKK